MEFDNKHETIYINNSDDSNIDLREIIEKYGYHWKWFVLSLIIAIISAYSYLYYTPNQYTVSSTIFIDDEDSGGLTNELTAFEDLGVFGGTKTTIINEMGVLKSITLTERVIKYLGINITYYQKGKVIDTELYKNTVPFNINFFVKDSIMNNLETTFTITPYSTTHFLLSKNDDETITKGVYGKNIMTSFGEINVIPKVINNNDLEDELIVKISPLETVARSYRGRIRIEPESIKSSLLILSLTDPVKQKAQDILDYLVIQYNKDAIEFKRSISKNTDRFINERIIDISDDLKNVDVGVEEFKTKNKLTDLDYEANLVLQSNAELEKTIIDLSSQIKLVDYVTSHLENNQEQLIPSNLGLKDQKTSESASIYNRLLLERNRIIKNSSKLNPTVINLDSQLKTLRNSIVQGLINFRSSLVFSLNEAKNQSLQLGAKRIRAPKQEREFQDIKRKQQIVESLYLYLLQKREENAISLGIPVPNAKIIDKANGLNTPTTPNPIKIYIIFFTLSIVITTLIISVHSFFDNMVHTRDELEKIVRAPIIGDVPKTESKQKIVVSNNMRSSTAESFRLLRTNLNYMLSSVKAGAKTIFITSTIGGEGKTFIAINLASALALTNKNILLIGADLRKPKINEYLNIHKSKGLSHYLVNTDLKVSDIILSYEKTNIDIIVSGEIPPNPSELLMNGRFDEILKYGKDNYDYILIDTPPVSLVTDALLISHHANLFIYVVRADYLDKRLLKTPKNMYDQNRLPNMALLLNDTNFKNSAYGYSYGYS